MSGAPLGQHKRLKIGNWHIIPYRFVMCKELANWCIFTQQTRSYIVCHVSGQLMNVSPIFTLLVALHLSSPTPDGNISVRDSSKCVHLLCGAEQVLTFSSSEPCHQKTTQWLPAISVNIQIRAIRGYDHGNFSALWGLNWSRAAVLPPRT